MNSRKIILAKNPKLANSRNSRKFLPKISRIFPLAKVSSAKVSSFKVYKSCNRPFNFSFRYSDVYTFFAGFFHFSCLSLVMYSSLSPSLPLPMYLLLETTEHLCINWSTFLSITISFQSDSSHTYNE